MPEKNECEACGSVPPVLLYGQSGQRLCPACVDEEAAYYETMEGER